ncbi:MAG: hypothetical protein A2622_09570 [Bdellovibrionales bacterium RIFCSPHIGHO2_01_FULL_40_29]|nr:MAG: hypothetical protein A2622_09570 [Bdellovibrionales bacterium RIFCSPHIGHO2_01_FULL_40_29]OFZ33529.1 MAG: hypothetical protein A3D17_00050 [Bdellovibrionales bacterium RIFCSPHIGHO2_02_FULL_40_15]
MNKTALLSAALTGLMMAGCAYGVAATPDASGTVAQGECHGMNSCKGTGECGGAGHSCAGKNSCKGKGWVKLSKADCEAKGGTFKGM